MIERIGERLTMLAQRWLPDPFILALLLTLTVVVLALVVTPASLSEVVDSWGPRVGDGFWGFLAFSMQMCLVLVGGHAIASSPPVGRAICTMARWPRSSASAAAGIAAVAMVAGLINWGLGLLVGAFLAREVGRAARREGRRLHYPLLGAAGYSGLLVWHGGLSGSAPLDIAPTVPISETLGHSMNLVINGLLLVVVPAVFALMAPRAQAAIVEAPLDGEELEPKAEEEMTPARWLERARGWTLLFGAAAAWALARGSSQRGLAYVDLYSMTFLFLFVGWALHGRPDSFVRAVEQGARGCGGIILQFPFYAGIVAIMAGSHLTDVFADWIRRGVAAGDALGISPQVGFSVLTFLVAAVVNLFVPSGGAQWKLMGPVVMAAGSEVGMPAGRSVMLVAYGDELTNMIQPFWALALLGVTGLEARQIMGYTATVMLAALPVMLGGIVLL